MKKIIFSFIIVQSINVIAQIPTNGLVGFYPFTGNALDSSSNANHGTEYGATLTTDRFGKSNSAYYFDTSLQNYIEIGTNNLLTNTFTYSLWAYFTNYPTSGNIGFCLSIGNVGGDQGISLQNNYLNKSTGWCAGGYNTKPPLYPTQQYTNPATGKWYHVLMARDTNSVSLYLDGVLLDTFSTSTKRIPFYSNSTPLAKIGIRANGIQGYNGKLDDIRLYNRALDTNEIKSLAKENRLGVENIFIKSTTKIYPNPAKNYLLVDIGNAHLNGNYQLKLSNVLGQIVFTKPIDQQKTQVNTSSLKAHGVYIVQILDSMNHVIYTEKLIIE